MVNILRRSRIETAVNHTFDVKRPPRRRWSVRRDCVRELPRAALAKRKCVSPWELAKFP